MESTFALSAPSHHHLKIPKSLPRNPRNLPNLFNLSSSSSSRSRTFDSISINAVSASSFSTSSSSSSSQRFGGSWISAPFVRRRNGFNIQAASVPENVGEDSKPKSGVVETVKLGLLFVLWYLVNIYFNIVNKQVLKAYPFPMTLSAMQFGIGTVIILFMWILNLHKKPNISTLQLLAILPLAIAHTLGNLFTNVSLVKVAVSFTHTIKAMEPFFTVILSALFLGEMPTLWVVSSLVPIVGGVALASATEASFDWLGFSSAMASNLTNQSRNVFSKKLMGKKEESLDNITLFSIITIMSFILTVPVALFMEGVKFTPSYMHYAGINVNEMYRGCLLSGICYHAYQQISYMILQKVSPVTHAVSNCLKRVVVIVASVLFFQTPVSPVNSLGTGVALVGVFLYSRVKQIKPKPKTL